MAQILLVFADRDLGREIKRTLVRELHVDGVGPVVTLVESEEDAKAHLQAEWDVVIVHLHIPKDFDSSMESTEERGLRLIQWMKESNNHSRAVLVTPGLSPGSMEEIWTAIHDMPWATVVREGADFTTRLVKKVEAFPAVAPKYLDIEITLGKQLEACRYRCHGRGFDHYREGPLKLDDEKLGDLAKESKVIPIEPGKGWKQRYTEVGEKLMRQLFNENARFTIHVAQGLEKAGGLLEGSTVRFVVERGFHRVLFEALKYPDSQECWMLQAPMYRRLQGGDRRNRPLFHRPEEDDRSAINCLIIDANVNDVLIEEMKDSNGESLRLVTLPNVTNECVELERKLKRQKCKWNIGKIKLLKRESNEPKFSDRVKKTLLDSPWQVVHFAGHSHYDVERKTGYVFFQDTIIQEIDIVKFSSWLRQTRFVFLSSCQSAEEEFVFSLVEHQVPAVAGFRWKVDDELAAEYASSFYDHLFKERSLERTFLKACQASHDQHEDDRIWASPMLIVQG